ncbi:MAG TPA: hypothetical protein DIT07_03215 [Sphingobacteriaceae bacterium]|nr:hypothetical protein [Sphingobacteriaceae bacterium]
MEILINAIVKAAGWSIIHSLWQGAILYTILLLLFILNPKLTAKSRHNLAFMALCGISLWFTMTFYNEFTARLYIARNPEIINTYSSVTTSVNHNIIKLPASLLYKAEQSIPFIVLIYGIGLIMQIVYMAFGYYRIQHIKTRGISDLEPDLNARFIAIISKIKIKRKVLFKLSSIVSVPMVIGYFKPVVLLPLSVLAQMNQDQLEAIIIHELSHIRRNDYLLNLLKISIETILFFNPFVWLSAKLIDTERENACDDLVLKITGSPLSYAQTLLQLEKLKSGQQVFALAATGKKYHLLNRIKRITTMKTSNSNLKQQLFGIFLIAATVISISWINIKKDNSLLHPSPKLELEALKRSKAELMEKAHSHIQPFIKPHFEVQTDTTKKKFKIIVADEKGNIKEYNNIRELPEELRAEFMKQTVIPPIDTTYFASMKKMYSTPEFKKQMEDMQKMQKKMFDNPEWKKHNEEIAKMFDNPEWKMKMDEFQKQFDSPEWKKHNEDLAKMFDNPEWKAKMQDFQKQFDSPEWKAKMQDFQKQFESKEWKEYFETMKKMFVEPQEEKKGN